MRERVEVMRHELKTMQRFSVDQVKSICGVCQRRGDGVRGRVLVVG